jgi:hypothetical protein
MANDGHHDDDDDNHDGHDEGKPIKSGETVKIKGTYITPEGTSAPIEIDGIIISIDLSAAPPPVATPT